MQVFQDQPKFRPVWISLETQDDYDKLLAIVECVAEDRIIRVPQVIQAAKTLHNMLKSLEDE